ncbi:hypothetical protein EWM64_g7999 [Hericium alpestre]|uniref:Uncharacterized protein n=1 Tax=Hericium alpestre TaxID=135208 RepID=A0A4Y9ZMJ5_9AGAM|nr:hypothetical protein EWM64_g7999 [Hericium alpestre]
MDYCKIMPLTYEELMQWAYITANGNTANLSRQYSLFHLSMVGKTHLIMVSICGIAVLGEHVFPPTGNWDGTTANACCATILMTLLPGPMPEQFGALRSAVSNICKLVHRSTASGGPENMDEFLGPMDSMYFHCHTFTRVSGMDYKPPSILTIVDDPNNATVAIADHWHVIDGISFGMCNADRSVLATNCLIFGQGDLVSILFTFDIVTVHCKDGPPTIVVHLCPEQVVQLCPAAEVNNIFVMPNVSLLPQFEGMQLLDSTLVIDHEDGDYNYFEEVDGHEASMAGPSGSGSHAGSSSAVGNLELISSLESMELMKDRSGDSGIIL